MITKEINRDSLGKTDVKLKFIPQDTSVIGGELKIQGIGNIRDLKINGRPLEWANKYDFRISVLSFGPDGLSLEYSTDTDEPLTISLIQRSLRIPKDWLKNPIPPNFIPGPGGFSDVIMTRQKVVL